MLLTLALVTPVLTEFDTRAASTRAADANLAYGCGYEIYSEAAVENAFPKLVIQDEAKKLTDGKTAPASAHYTDSAYLKIYRGIYHTVEIDLGGTRCINGYSAGFFACTSDGVFLPRELYFSVSKDGENWFTLFSTVDNTVSVPREKRRVSMGETSADYYEARYVRLKFSTDVFVFLDEIEVYGVESGVVSKPYSYDAEPTYPNRFAPNDNNAIDNIKNLVLMYNGEYYKNEPHDLGNNSYDELLPYAAYIDSTKNILDTMFDTFLFLPLDPDDNAVYTLKKQSGWEAYLNNTINAQEANMPALDKLVGDIKADLGLDDDYKVNVFISVPYTGFDTGSVFGKLDGETALKPDSLENVTAIMKWYIDLALEKYKEADFQNLNLTGFYWYQEVVSFQSYTFEVDFIKAFNAYVHSKGYGSIWIPYYCAPGANMWEELGFDCTCLQSGYAFKRDPSSEPGTQKEESVYDSMSFAKKYGLGVEIELGSTDVANYNVYIKNAAKLGCMDEGVTMFYQDGGPGKFYSACFNSAIRSIYDDTYRYIKQKYEKGVPTLNFDGLILVEKNFTKTNGKLPVSDADTAINRLRLAELETVLHGELSLDADGFFVYIPEEGYTGEDSFSFSLTDGYNVSETYTVDILVVEDLFRYSTVNSPVKEGKAVLYTEGDNTGTAENGELTVFEMAVGPDGEITSAAYQTSAAIPENGFVISAAGGKAAELEALAAAGGKVILDKITKSVYFRQETEPETSDEISGEISAETSKPDDDSGKLTIVLFIIAAAAVVFAAFAVIKIIKAKSKSK